MAKRNSKYNAKKCIFNGIKFPSIRERDRYIFLLDRKRKGEIDNLRLQVPIYLEGRDGPLLTRTGRKMRLTVDFVYDDMVLGAEVWEDSKGAVTRDYEVRRAVAQAMGYKIEEV